MLPSILVLTSEIIIKIFSSDEDPGRDEYFHHLVCSFYTTRNFLFWRRYLESMKYVDGFVIVVHEDRIDEYREMAKMGEMLWMKHGALEYFECLGEDLEPENMPGMTFLKMANTKPGEKVIFSFIVFESRAHRDRVNAMVMNDPMMNDPARKDNPMPFDIDRMAYGGFQVIVGGK